MSEKSLDDLVVGDKVAYDDGLRHIVVATVLRVTKTRAIVAPHGDASRAMTFNKGTGLEVGVDHDAWVRSLRIRYVTDEDRAQLSHQRVLSLSRRLGHALEKQAGAHPHVREPGLVFGDDDLAKEIKALARRVLGKLDDVKTVLPTPAKTT